MDLEVETLVPNNFIVRLPDNTLSAVRETADNKALMDEQNLRFDMGLRSRGVGGQNTFGRAYKEADLAKPDTHLDQLVHHGHLREPMASSNSSTRVLRHRIVAGASFETLDNSCKYEGESAPIFVGFAKRDGNEYLFIATDKTVVQELIRNSRSGIGHSELSRINNWLWFYSDSDSLIYVLRAILTRLRDTDQLDAFALLDHTARVLPSRDDRSLATHARLDTILLRDLTNAVVAYADDEVVVPSGRSRFAPKLRVMNNAPEAGPVAMEVEPDAKAAPVVSERERLIVDCAAQVRSYVSTGFTNFLTNAAKAMDLLNKTERTSALLKAGKKASQGKQMERFRQFAQTYVDTSTSTTSTSTSTSTAAASTPTSTPQSRLG